MSTQTVTSPSAYRDLPDRPSELCDPHTEQQCSYILPNPLNVRIPSFGLNPAGYVQLDAGR